MVERISIPNSVAAEVLFAADRTCCVCRLEKHKVQIHHIDGNPSNNSIDNLAVICLHCHSEAHTNGAFVRNLTPELIRLYNSSWRDIVKLRLQPSAPNGPARELAAEAFLEATLDCHSWKIFFMTIAGPSLPSGAPGQFVDVWGVMAELWIPTYSDDTYKKYRPLFDSGLRDVQKRFDRLIQLFPDVLPHRFRAELVRASRALETQRTTYLLLPTLRAISEVAEEINVAGFFAMRFTEVIQVLSSIARDADRLRNESTATSDSVRAETH